MEKKIEPKKLFHIHVDAIEMDSKFEDFLIKNLGLYRVNYEIDPDSVDLAVGSKGHEYHLTFKTDSPDKFGQVRKEIFDAISRDNPIRNGYVECEFVLDYRLDYVSYNEIPVPFKLTMRKPLPGAFRESELHVTVSRDESDSRLLKKLREEMGLLSGFIPKDYGVAQIFTAQGTQRQINRIFTPLLEFVQASGGAARCSIKEERTTGKEGSGYWMSHPDGIGLPLVINEIK